MNWLFKNWPYAAFFTAVFLLLLAPFIYVAFGLPFLLIYLHLPMYQVHQLEEHYHDRFRLFANRMIAGGLEMLTPCAVFWINCLGVWVLDFVLFYAAMFGGLAWGLGIIYMSMFNAVTHIAASVRLRCYNPGLWTSIFLFLPVGAWALNVVTKASGATWTQQAIGLAIGVVTHAVIFGFAAWRRSTLLKQQRS